MTARDELWHAWRADGIGASDVPIIVGLAPPSWGKSPYTLWLEKAGVLPPDDHESENMTFGKYAERMVAPWFHDLTGLYLAGEQTLCHRPDAPWARCTVDAFVVDGGGHEDLMDAAGMGHLLDMALGVAEIKTTNDAPEAWEHEIPDHYLAQVQWQLYVTGMDHAWIPALHLAFGRHTLRVHEVARDQETIDWLIARCSEFWRLVQENDPPPIDASEATGRALAAQYADAENDTVVDLTNLADDITTLRQCKEDLARIERVMVGAENRVKAAMADQTDGYVNGQRVVTWRRSMAVDVAKLEADHPELCDRYRKLDLTALVKGNRRLAGTYKTVPGSRRFLLKET
jgi:putative phage-type endonuclease